MKFPRPFANHCSPSQQGTLPLFYGSLSGAFVTIDLSETMFPSETTTGRHFVAT